METPIAFRPFGRRVGVELSHEKVARRSKEPPHTETLRDPSFDAIAGILQAKHPPILSRFCGADYRASLVIAMVRPLG
jgi:hypothetical protein